MEKRITIDDIFTDKGINWDLIVKVEYSEDYKFEDIIPVYTKLIEDGIITDKLKEGIFLPYSVNHDPRSGIFFGEISLRYFKFYFTKKEDALAFSRARSKDSDIIIMKLEEYFKK